MLTTTQADNLERYVLCEQWLNGSARSTDYSGDRVQSGRVNMYPIPDNRLPLLAMHARNKARVSKHHLIILDAFIAQQLGLPGARTDAQLGLALDPATRNAALTWRRAIVEAADALGAA